MIEQIFDSYPEENFISLDGLEDAVIGVIEDENGDNPRLVYSVSKCIECLMRGAPDPEVEDGMTVDEQKYWDAMEWFDYNTRRAIPYMRSHGTPPMLLEDNF